MNRKIIYIINPVSGTGSKKNLEKLIEIKTREKNIPFSIYPSSANGDYTFLKSIIRDEKITDIVIAGGDGTVSRAVGSLMPHEVNFGIIPCGSGNGLAFAAKIPRDYSKALDIIFKGKPAWVDAFSVNGNFACMLAGLGFDAQVAHDFAHKTRRGLMAYIILVIQNFISAKPFPATLQLPESTFETDALFISIANSNQFGNHFTIAPKASLHDGLLDIIIVNRRNKLNIILQLLKQLAGANRLQAAAAINPRKPIVYFQSGHLKIINSGMAPLHIDGEPAGTARHLEITVKQKCFRLIQP